MSIEFSVPRGFENPEVQELSQFMVDEFNRLIQVLNTGQDIVMLNTLYEEPRRVSDGMVVYADGTEWNPGSGIGFYGRQNGAWIKL